MLVPLNPLAPPAERRLHAAQTKEFETQQLGLREIKQSLITAIHAHYLAPMCQSVIRMPNRTIDNARVSIRRIYTDA